MYKSNPLKIAMFCIFFVVGALSAAAQTSRPSLHDRLDETRVELIHSLNDFRARLDTPQADPTVRTYTYAAHYALAVGLDPSVAEDFVRRAMARQDMDPSSPRYGDVPWEMFRTQINDPNSIEFTFTSVGPILLGYADKLSPEFKREMMPHVVGAIAAIERHKVDVGYTNIFLMKTENLLLLGEFARDQQAINQARAQLDDWLQYTRAHGIREYASPTYAAVQLNCLLNAYRHTRQTDLKPKLKQALDYLWADAAANYFAPGNVLAGAHSRDYDFLHGGGSIDRFYWIEGFRDVAPLPGLFADAFGAYVNVIEHGYRPSPEILHLARQEDRVIQASWDVTPGADRYTYITPDFAVGSTSAFYGPQNREVAVDLGDQRAEKPVSICVSGDTFDAPYGKTRIKDKSGHDKPHRLRTNVASVQEKGTVLALFDLSPDLPRTPAATLATDVLIPLTADWLVLDGRKIQLSAEISGASDSKQPGEQAQRWEKWAVPAHCDSVLGIRYGHAAVAIRIFAADGVDGADPQYVLKCDGAPWGAGRLVVYHYQGALKRIKQTPVRAGVLIICDHCDADGDLDALMHRAAATRVEQTMQSGVWDVRASDAIESSESLEAALDCKTGEATIRKVNGATYQPQRFTENGRDLATEILGPAPAAAETFDINAGAK